MKGNEVTKSEKQTAFERILRFMNEGDIVLSSREEEILARWSFAHKLIIHRKYREQEIIEKIAATYQVSEFTARSDIYQAHALYGGSIKSNKKYLLHHHAENILLEIERCKKDKSLMHLLPKLLDAYTKAVQALPAEMTNDTLPPPVMNFIVVKGQQIKTSKSFEEAWSEADALIKEDAEKEFTEFEDLTDENTPPPAGS